MSLEPDVTTWWKEIAGAITLAMGGIIHTIFNAHGKLKEIEEWRIGIDEHIQQCTSDNRETRDAIVKLCTQMTDTRIDTADMKNRLDDFLSALAQKGL